MDVACKILLLSFLTARLAFSRSQILLKGQKCHHTDTLLHSVGPRFLPFLRVLAYQEKRLAQFLTLDLQLAHKGFAYQCGLKDKALVSAVMASKNASHSRLEEEHAGQMPNGPSKSPMAKPTDYSSHGVTDNDIFMLPSSDLQLLGIITVIAAIVRLFRIYQPSSVVFDEVQ